MSESSVQSNAQEIVSETPDLELAGRISIGQVVDQLSEEFPELTGSKIRFLENRKLIKLSRTVSGYRMFSAHDVKVLRWILTCQRDKYLPLNVIAGQIERGEHLADIWGQQEQPAAQTLGLEFDDHEEAPQPADSSNSSSNPVASATSTSSTDSSNSAPNSPAPSNSTSSNGAQQNGGEHSGGAKTYTLDELCAATGLEPSQINELIDYAILKPLDQSQQVQAQQTQTLFNEDALAVARIAHEFATHGVEPRHLRISCNAAKRDAGMYVQSLQPVVYASSPDADDNARHAAERLLQLGDHMRTMVMRAAMAEILD